MPETATTTGHSDICASFQEAVAEVLVVKTCGRRNALR